MLAVAVSLLFAVTAATALAVVATSLRAAQRRARLILAELAEIDRPARVTREKPVRGARPGFPLLAAA